LKVIPSIDLKDGKSVKLVRGIPGTGIEVSDDPVELSAYWESQGAEILHLIDLDGALTNKDTNRDTIGRIIESVSIPVEVGGGIRSVDDALGILGLGARWVIIGTKAVEDRQFVAELINFISSENIIIALDTRGGRLVTHGWQKETELEITKIIQRLDRFRPAAYLSTKVDVEGMMTGIDVEEVKGIVLSTRTPIIYSGGVSSLEDIRNLKKAGVYGVVVGMALYKGVFKFREAMEVVSDA